MPGRFVASLDAYQRRHRRVGFPIAVVYKFTDDQGSYLTALITYYGFLSLFPLLLVAIAPFALAYVVVRDHELSWARGELTAVLAITALGLVLYVGIVDRPGEPPGQIELAAGWYVAVLGCVLMLVGAARRGAKKTAGIHAELQRRVESSARGLVDRGAGLAAAKSSERRKTSRTGRPSARAAAATSGSEIISLPPNAPPSGAACTRAGRRSRRCATSPWSRSCLT